MIGPREIHGHPSDVSLGDLLIWDEHPSLPSSPLITPANNQLGSRSNDKKKERVLKKSKSRKNSLLKFGCPLARCGSLPFMDSDDDDDSNNDYIYQIEVNFEDNSFMDNLAMASSSSSSSTSSSSTTSTSTNGTTRNSTISSSWFGCSSSSFSSTNSTSPPPRGYLPVDVGSSEKQRFLVKASIINHPSFQTLLQMSEDEFGFNLKGVLTIPCDVLFFQRILSIVIDEVADASSPSPRSISDLDMSLLTTRP